MQEPIELAVALHQRIGNGVVVAPQPPFSGRTGRSPLPGRRLFRFWHCTASSRFPLRSISTTVAPRFAHSRATASADPCRGAGPVMASMRPASLSGQAARGEDRKTCSCGTGKYLGPCVGSGRRTAGGGRGASRWETLWRAILGLGSSVVSGASDVTPSSGKRRACGSTCRSSDPTAELQASTALLSSLAELVQVLHERRQAFMQFLTGSRESSLRSRDGLAWRHPYETVFSSAMSVDGVARMHPVSTRSSSRSGRSVRAALKELIARQKQYRELRAVFELRPVVLAAELANSCFHLHATWRVQRNSARLVVHRFDGFEVCIERRFHVDDQRAPIPACG